jgi:diaminohydroxyphosphoribosylaminopyrimidine deaminase / 5-amino-6-(5-phosphoribosylamino)uracil reductase
MKSPLHERPLITEEHGIASSHLSVAGKVGPEDMTDQVEPDNPAGNALHWFQVPSNFRTGTGPLPEPWEGRFGPLRQGAIDDLVVVGQIGQSIDGRIATVTGHSKYINGPAGLAHLHRLRALVDAVLVGIGTAVADDPQLTVRRVTGPSPARIVLDPRGRLPPDARVLTADGVRRIVITAEGVRPSLPEDVEIAGIPARGGEIAPAAILGALAERGLRRILIEGGAHTVSRFIAAGCLDRLHVMVAPIMFGSGQTGVTLAPIATADQALRSPMRAHLIGDEVLLDCDLSAQRVVIGCAKKST